MTLGVPDVDAVASYYEDFGLRRVGVDFERDAGSLRVRDTNSALQVSVQVSPRITEAAAKQEPTNGPGRPDRPNGRAPAIERAARVRPRRLGHVVAGSLDQEASQRFFTEGLGFKVSDRVPGLASFMRCSADHHNLLVQQAPVNFLHHTACNFFWYLKDPVGNFSEYYSDLDIILDDQLWKPSVVEGARGLYNWGPPPPPSFIQPEDLAALMTGSHAPTG